MWASILEYVWIKTKYLMCRCLISGRQMIQMALSIATGLSHLHIEIIGTQVSLLFFCKKIIPDPDPDFFGESGSGLIPRIFYFRKFQKITVAKFLQFFSGLPEGLPKLRISLRPSRKNIYLVKTFHSFFSY